MQQQSAVDGVPGATLQATDVSYGVTVSKQYKIILRNVNLAVYPGDLCAMMGSSGAGKR
jgi:ABC-type transporter Mla maintaining outer membrane lipid asymmetry ATPase subunit MlaF